MKDDPDSRVRRAAAETFLGKVIDPRVVDPLIAALKDPDAEVRFAAVDGTWVLKDPHV
jgi:HEAT repeat protein